MGHAPVPAFWMDGVVASTSTYTSGAGYFTVPRYNRLVIKMWGAGGSGGGATPETAPTQVGVTSGNNGSESYTITYLSSGHYRTSARGGKGGVGGFNWQQANSSGINGSMGNNGAGGTGGRNDNGNTVIQAGTSGVAGTNGGGSAFGLGSPPIGGNGGGAFSGGGGGAYGNGTGAAGAGGAPGGGGGGNGAANQISTGGTYYYSGANGGGGGGGGYVYSIFGPYTGSRPLPGQQIYWSVGVGGAAVGSGNSISGAGAHGKIVIQVT